MLNGKYVFFLPNVRGNPKIGGYFRYMQIKVLIKLRHIKPCARIRILGNDLLDFLITLKVYG